MSKLHKQWACLGLGLLLLVGAVGCANGKSDDSIGSVNEATSTTQTEAPTEPPALLHEGQLGEEFSYGGVTATLDHAYLSDYTFIDGDQEMTVIFYQLTITNNTDQNLKTNFMSNSFFMVADGEAVPYSGLRSTKMIAMQFGEDAENFFTDVEPGETRQGYVYMEIPADFSESRLIYYPAAGVGDRMEDYSFKIAREDLEPAPEPVTPFA